MNIKECVDILKQRQVNTTTNSISITETNNSTSNGTPSCFHSQHNQLREEIYCQLSSSHLKRANFLLDKSNSIEIQDNILVDIDKILGNYSELELIDLFLLLQQERVQIYKEFNEYLQILVQNNNLSDYPHICSEITSMFSVISQQIILIKTKLVNNSISGFISNIQQFEKDKLFHVAAKHLDIMRRSSSQLDRELGENTSDSKYLDGKINDLEEMISEKIEEIQIYKFEIMKK